MADFKGGELQRYVSMEFLSAAQSKASLTGWHGELFVSCYELASVRAGNHTGQICLSSNRTEQCSEGASWAALDLSPTSYAGSLGLRPFAEESRVFWDTLGHPACPAIASQEDGVCQQPCVTPSTLVEVTQSHCCLCNGSRWLVSATDSRLSQRHLPLNTSDSTSWLPPQIFTCLSNQENDKMIKISRTFGLILVAARKCSSEYLGYSRHLLLFAASSLLRSSTPQWLRGCTFVLGEVSENIVTSSGETQYIWFP